MEALIYNESPIADYLEADAIPFKESPVAPTAPSRITSFAPRGLPTLHQKLESFRGAATSATDVTNERFRYLIVASQLLSHDTQPRRNVEGDHVSRSHTLPMSGALTASAVSFFMAFSVHFLRRLYQNLPRSQFADVVPTTLFLLAGVAFFVFLARRQYLDFVKISASTALEKLVADSHAFDTVVGDGLRFAQEVELVARGYGISRPLPPVSRLEGAESRGYCRELRLTIGRTLTAGIAFFADAHYAAAPFIRSADLQRYHDMYEVSMQEYADATTLASQTSVDTHNTLRDLRFLHRVHSLARKVFLCDLLALPTGATWQDIQRWRSIANLLHAGGDVVSQNASAVHSAFARGARIDITPPSDEQRRTQPGDDHPPKPSGQERHARAQMRSIESVVQALRSLNAKAHLLGEEMHTESVASDDGSLTAGITRQYDELGMELRAALMEWEKGRDVVFSNVGIDGEDWSSRAFSDARSPSSPSPSSLDGATLVEGGPAEALRALSGDDRSSPEARGMEEEVFEAMAVPRQRMSWAAMSREEKLSKMRQDRQKRATLQEQADNTTNMLRELQMVIKHRPSVRSGSRVSSV